MPASSSKRLGYGGSAEVDGEQVLISSGGFDTQVQVSYLQALSMPPTAGASRTRAKHADGVAAYSGTVDLDVTDSFLNVLTTSKLLARAYKFTVGIDDGEDAEDMTDVYLTSLSLQGAPGGFITASMAFTGASAPATSVGVANAFVRDDAPYGYWYSGNTDVIEWAFTFAQDAQPVYSNEDVTAPRYVRVGPVDYSLQVTSFEAVLSTSVINIATRTFSLTGDTTSQGFQYLGQNDLGQYSHVFETAADITVGSDDTVLA